MTASPVDTKADLHAIIAALCAERDAAISEKAALAEALAKRNNEFGERIEHQAATIDVLKAMSASPSDPQPVFDLIVERARDLCGAYGATVYEFDGTLIHYRAATGVSDDATVREQVAALYPMLPTRASTAARAILDRRIIRIDDLEGEPDLYPILRRQTAKSAVIIPLMRGDVAMGALALGSRERAGFSNGQIDLLKTFAEQAVIAISSAETYRALQGRTSDLQEALEQQTATAEVLQLLNVSPGNLAPVFDAMLQKALTLCGAAFGQLVTFDGSVFRAAAWRGYEPGPGATAPAPGMALYQLVHGEQIVHIPDITADEVYRSGNPVRRRLADDYGGRTAIWVALRKDEKLLGAFVIYRTEVRPFSVEQITLLQNFAAQAVIAIENARLLTETREALEQQTATTEVLQVINANPGNLAPVFEAMLDKAIRLCDAGFGHFRTYDGERFPLVAVRGDQRFVDVMQQRSALVPGPHHPLARIIAGEEVNHIANAADSDAYRNDPRFRELVDTGVCRSLLGVALRKGKTLLGYLVVYRQEVRPFSDKQIALLQNFAAQAVIAMENARLLTQQREALEQQTATAEVLGVINSNPGDLAPVFDAMLEKAHGLCGIAMGSLELYDGQRFRAVAVRGLSDTFADMLRQGYPASENPATGPLIDGGRLTHIRDLAETDYAITRSGAELDAARTLLCVPLRREGTLLGMIASSRKEARPFSDKEIALLENFAAQAVIAMDNARLITELRQRSSDLQQSLEYQTATSDVLRVIGRSGGELDPVLQTLVETAARICIADGGLILRLRDGQYHIAASVGFSTEFKEHHARTPTRPDRGTVTGRVAIERRVVHVEDVAADSQYVALRSQELGQTRTMLGVPLFRDGSVAGVITLSRSRVEPFTERQIELVSTFADQAVIAIENTRLLTEQREALEHQTAIAEVLGVINSSLGELKPVFDAVLEKAVRLCDSGFGILCTYDGDTFSTVAVQGTEPALTEFLRAPVRPRPGGTLERIVHGGDVVQVADVTDDEAYRSGSPSRKALADLGGGRTQLLVALRNDEKLLGTFVIFRQEVRPFSTEQIALLKSFAAQAVIAMENARLITETREALEQQTATADILRVISSSPTDVQPTFDAIAESATTLCGAASGGVFRFDGSLIHTVAQYGLAPDELEAVRRIYPHPPGRGGVTARAVLTCAVVHVADTAADPEYGFPGIVQSGLHTALSVPMLHDGKPIGAITVTRREVAPFSKAQVELLRTFADQALIAIENVRLFVELRDRTNELAQRQAELRVTFENMGDGVALFDETRHLVASNKRFQDMLDVPDGVISSRPAFADYIRYLADRGEYGPDPEDHVQNLLAFGSQPIGFERTRPNGRILEIRGNPVPGGGFVVIYSDITERKRNEEELLAARDAAEEASRSIETAYRELKTAQASLIQAEKMASLGQLTAGIAHEIKNPLNFVNNFAALSVDLLEELKETATPGFAALTEKQRAEIEDVSAMLTSNLEKITEHGKRADGIVKAMLDHSRGSSGERRRVDLNALIDEALNLAYHGARAQDQSFNIALERHFAAGMAPIELAPQDMTRVFLNLFSNGFYAATRQGQIGADAGFMPTLKITTSDSGEAIEVRVRDNGIGIPAEIQDKLFQPFFTTKPTGEGTGLGLSITYDIVTQQHGGSITVDSKVGEYSEFTIRLPKGR